MVGKDADLARAREAIAAKRGASASAPLPIRTWPDEKPAMAWLSDEARAAFTARGEWLEKEARTVADKVARARWAPGLQRDQVTLGERERAQALAGEARDLAPSLGLAHRQARALMLQPPDPEEFLEALDTEVKMTPAGPARVHSMLLAVDALRMAATRTEPPSGSTRRRIGTGDTRALILRAVRALGRNETTSATLRLPDAVEELVPVAEALQNALRLRGVERKDASPGKPRPTRCSCGFAARSTRATSAGPFRCSAQLASVPELAAGATWLAASLAATTRPGAPSRLACCANWWTGGTPRRACRSSPGLSSCRIARR